MKDSLPSAKAIAEAAEEAKKTKLEAEKKAAEEQLRKMHEKEVKEKAIKATEEKRKLEAAKAEEARKKQEAEEAEANKPVTINDLETMYEYKHYNQNM